MNEFPNWLRSLLQKIIVGLCFFSLLLYRHYSKELWNNKVCLKYEKYVNKVLLISLGFIWMIFIFKTHFLTLMLGLKVQEKGCIEIIFNNIFSQKNILQTKQQIKIILLRKGRRRILLCLKFVLYSKLFWSQLNPHFAHFNEFLRLSKDGKFPKLKDICSSSDWHRAL